MLKIHLVRVTVNPKAVGKIRLLQLVDGWWEVFGKVARAPRLCLELLKGHFGILPMKSLG